MQAPRAVMLLGALGAVTPAIAAEGVSNQALAKAAQDTRLDQIDDFRKHCEDERKVGDWLKEVLADTSAKVRWAGGRCVLVNNINPLDGGTKWCGRAEIAQKGAKRPATIEVFFEKPQGGKPGTPFAFRAEMVTADGPDYMRETYAFEVNWKRKHWKNYEPPSGQDCD